MFTSVIYGTRRMADYCFATVLLVYRYTEMNGGICSNIDACNLQSINHESKFSILLLNINSLRGKISELRAFVSLSKIRYTFIILTEVKLTPGLDVDLDLDGYDSVSLYRNEFGGGMKIFYLSYLNVIRNNDENLTGLFNTHESIFVSCTIPGYKKLLSALFIDHLVPQEQRLFKILKKCCLAFIDLIVLFSVVILT